MGLMKKTLGIRCNFKASDYKMVNALSNLSQKGTTEILDKIDISMQFKLYKELADKGFYTPESSID